MNSQKVLLISLCFFIFLSFIACDASPRVLRHPDDPEPPTIDKWNWKIETSTYTYYAMAYTKSGKDIILHGFWAISGDGQYHYFDDDLTLNEDLYGEIKISRGPKYQIR